MRKGRLTSSPYSAENFHELHTAVAQTFRAWRMGKVCRGSLSRTRFTLVTMLSLVARLVLIASLLCGNARSATDSPPLPTVPPPSQEWPVGEDGVIFDTRFPGARLNECQVERNGEYGVIVRPENRPINDSAWFAFKVSAPTTRKITVHLKVEGGALRYSPKISLDGLSWLPLPAESFERGSDTSQGTLRLQVGPKPLWIAAQELVSTRHITAWAETLARLPYVKHSEFGRSYLGEPLQKIEIGTGAGHYVVVFGRQHPPETTGSLALMRFVETVAGDSTLARTFRREFSLLVIPLINPDGVDRGHWRHGVGGIDLNRDWGTFSQPETRAVGAEILALRKVARLWLHLDFHSTRYDVFYTQPDDEPTSPAGFTRAWIDAIQHRMPDYAVKRTSTTTPNPTTSHNWAHTTFGIPAITYEIGDNSDRALLQQIAAAAAEEMMKQLLAIKAREGN